ncbi:hypothetical protein V1511DRAFT_519642 [Dipodascopsis uninucleata]
MSFSAPPVPPRPRACALANSARQVSVPPALSHGGNDISRYGVFCTKFMASDLQEDVYTFPGCEDHWKICSNCYNTVIKPFGNTQIIDTLVPSKSKSFQQDPCRIDARTEVICSSTNPNAVHDLKAHIERLRDVKLCPEALPAKYCDYPAYINTHIINLTFCERCYIGNFDGGSMNRGFQRNDSKSSNASYICDMVLSLCRRAVKTNDWDNFRTLMSRYLYLAICPSIDVRSSNRQAMKWYCLPGLRDVNNVFCEFCYLQLFHDTYAASQVREIPPDPGHVCFVGENTPLFQTQKVHMDSPENFRTWLEALQNYLTIDQCQPDKPISRYRCFLVPDAFRDQPVQGLPQTGFDICARCFEYYFGILFPFFRNYFSIVTVQPTDHYTCDFTSGNRSAIIKTTLLVAATSGDFTKFSYFVQRVCASPPCVQRRTIQGGYWYRTADGYYCCPSCYEEVVRESPMRTFFSDQPALCQERVFCSFYSTRMRNLYSHACDIGSMAEFSAFIMKRNEVWRQTVPRIEALLAQAKMLAASQTTNMIAATMLHGASNVISASTGTSHYNYTDSTGITHDNYVGAQAANMDLQNSLPMSLAGIMNAIPQLEAVWKSVE